MIVALIVNPSLIGDLAEAARIKYGTSTLGDVDVEACMKKLEWLMTERKAYLLENLSLASLAAELGISSHQLSELINTRLGMGFSRYVRARRVEAAKALLVSAPSQSILSVSMERASVPSPRSTLPSRSSRVNRQATIAKPTSSEKTSPERR